MVAVVSCMDLKNMVLGNSLAVQWLRLLVLTAEGLGSIRGQGTKISQTVRCGQKTNKQTKPKKTMLLSEKNKRKNETRQNNLCKLKIHTTKHTNTKLHVRHIRKIAHRKGGEKGVSTKSYWK